METGRKLAVLLAITAACDGRREPGASPPAMETADGAAPTSSAPASVEVSSPLTGCERPEVEEGPTANLASFASPTVTMTARAPHLTGPHGAELERLLRELLEVDHSARQKEWTRCQGRSQLGLGCPPWSVLTECESSTAGDVYSMVCRNRLTDELGGRSSVDYRTLNVTHCQGGLYVLDFERELCPESACAPRLRTLLLATTGHPSTPVLSEEPIALRHVLSQFLPQEDRMLFYAGNSALYDLNPIEGAPFGHNVLALSYPQLREAAPSAATWQQRLSLLP